MRLSLIALTLAGVGLMAVGVPHALVPSLSAAVLFGWVLGCGPATRAANLAGLATAAALASQWLASEATGAAWPRSAAEMASAARPFFLFAMAISSGWAFAEAGRDRRLGSVVLLLLAGAMVAVVASVSGSAGNSDGTVRLIMAVTGLPEEQARPLVLPFRKTVHFVGYGFMALAAAGSMLAAGDASRRRVSLFALGYAAIVAAFDEARQLGYPDRTGTFADWVLDLAGAATFVGVLLALRRDRSQTASDGA